MLNQQSLLRDDLDLHPFSPARPSSACQQDRPTVVLDNFKGAAVPFIWWAQWRTGAGYKVLTDTLDLPDGVDLAILMVPAEVVLDTVKACVARGVKAAISFASGFAEMGDEGRTQQRQIAEVAQAGLLALLGPNTVGYFNYVDGGSWSVWTCRSFDPQNGPGWRWWRKAAASGTWPSWHPGALSYMMTTGSKPWAWPRCWPFWSDHTPARS
jgi:hypothetical protein